MGGGNSKLMRHLIWKDQLLQRWMVATMFLNTIVFCFVWRTADDYFAGALLGYILMIGVGGDSSRNSHVLPNSLPIPRWKIVGAKYLFSLAYVPIILLAFWFSSSILPLLELGAYAPSADPVNLVVRITSVVAMLVLYWPAYFAWDLTKARYWNFATFIVFGTMFRVLNSLIATLFPLTLTSDLNAALVLVALVAIMMGVSFCLSIRFYRRREF